MSHFLYKKYKYVQNSLNPNDSLDTTDFKQILDVCVDFQVDQYKVYPYIRAARYLQQVGLKEAVALLSQYAATQEYEHQLIVLCRMRNGAQLIMNW